MGARKPWPYPQGCLELLDRLREAPAAHERLAKITVAFGVVGPNPHSLLKLLDRLRCLSGLLEGLGEVVMRRRKPGLKADGGLILPYCLGNPAGAIKGI